MYILHSRGCVEIGRSRSACDRVVMTNRRVGGCNPSLRTHAHATQVLVRTRTPFYRPPNVFAIFMENISNKALSIYRQLACDVSRDKFLIFAAPKKKKKKVSPNTFSPHFSVKPHPPRSLSPSCSERCVEGEAQQGQRDIGLARPTET